MWIYIHTTLASECLCKHRFHILVIVNTYNNNSEAVTENEHVNTAVDTSYYFSHK